MKRETKVFFLILAFLCLTSYFSLAQKQGQELIDSLLTELPKSEEDTNKVNLLARLSFEYYMTDPDEGIKKAYAGLELAETLNWEKGKARCYKSLGSLYWAKSDYKISLQNHKKAIKIFEKLGEKQDLADNLSDIGNCYLYLTKFDQALESFQKALNLNGEIGDKKGLLKTQGNIGSVYFELKEYDKALDYYNQSLAASKEIGNKRYIAAVTGNIGLIYDRKLDYEQALLYYQKSNDAFKEIGDKSGIIINLINIAGIYLRMNEIGKSIEYHHEALDISEQILNKRLNTITLGNLGQIYYKISKDSLIKILKEKNSNINLNKKTNLKKAKELTIEALQISKEIDAKNVIISQYLSLTNIYQSLGNYKEAFNYQKKWIFLKDSVFNSDLSHKIGKLEAEREQMEKEFKEKEIARVRAEEESQRNMIQYSAIAILIIIMVIFLFLIPKFKVPFGVVDVMVFITFLLFYELVLVVTEPYIDDWTDGVPIYKLGINLGIALLFIPFHNFEKKLRKRYTKSTK